MDDPQSQAAAGAAGATVGRRAFQKRMAAGAAALLAALLAGCLGAKIGLLFRGPVVDPGLPGPAAARLPDEELIQYVLDHTALPTAPLERAEAAGIRGAMLCRIARAYVAFQRTVTGRSAMELYPTPEQVRIARESGWNVVSYHVPWGEHVLELTMILETPHPKPVHATIHFYDWENYLAATGQEALDVFHRAHESNVVLLIENRTAKELEIEEGPDKERYIRGIVEQVHAWRAQWEARHPGVEFPGGLTFNPWAYLIETRPEKVCRWARESGEARKSLREELTRDLMDFHATTLDRLDGTFRGLVRRVYLGNSDRCDLQLPPELQRGQVLGSPDSLFNDLVLVRHVLDCQPDLAEEGETFCTLETGPQAPVLSLVRGQRALWGATLGAVVGWGLAAWRLRARRRCGLETGAIE